MSRMTRHPKMPTTSAALVVALAIAACGPDRPAESVQREPAVTQTGDALDSAATAESSGRSVEQLRPGSRQPVEPPSESPFANFELPEDDEAAQPIIRYRLLIQNRMTQLIVVTATAGALPVMLDSIVSGASIRVDLEAPASGQADSVQIVRIEAESGPQ
jgi:hypothetical protein